MDKIIKIKPIVTIITPLFNREMLIYLTIESLLKQSFQNFEALIIDDGSEDNSKNIVNEYAKKDSRIKLITRNRLPKGASTCRNIGIENAKGKYLVFLDSDDLLAPFCLERRVKIMEKRTELDFSVFPGLRFKQKPYDSNLLISSSVEGDLIPYFLSLEIPWITLNVIWKKTTLIEKRLRWAEDIKSHQDIQFHVDAICLGFNYYLADSEPDCFWREHAYGNIGKNLIFPNMAESHIILHNHLFDSLNDGKRDSNRNIKRLNSIIFNYYRQYCEKGEIESAKKVLKYIKNSKLINNFIKSILSSYLFFMKFKSSKENFCLFLKFVYIFYVLFIWPWLIIKEKNKIFLAETYDLKHVLSD